MTKNWLIFPAIVGALLVGVLIGTKSCKKSDNGNVQITDVSKKTDTAYITNFIHDTVTIVSKGEDKIVIKTVLLKGSTDTIYKTIIRPEFQIKEVLKEKLVYAKTTTDSLLAYISATDSLNKKIDSLNTYGVFKGTQKSKLNIIDYSILGRGVTNIAIAVKTKNRLEVTPMIGLSYQTNGKAFKDFSYKPFLGGTINYNHFSLFGGMLLDTNTNDLNNYIMGAGYKISL